MVGASLAVAGVVMQSITRNPLGAPEILGINAGAAVTVALASTIAPGIASVGLIFLSFAGGAVAAALVFGLARFGRGGPQPGPARARGRDDLAAPLLADAGDPDRLLAGPEPVLLLADRRRQLRGVGRRPHGGAVDAGGPPARCASRAAAERARARRRRRPRARPERRPDAVPRRALGRAARRRGGRRRGAGRLPRADHAAHRPAARRPQPLRRAARLDGARRGALHLRRHRLALPDQPASRRPSGVVTALVGAPIFVYLARREKVAS